MPSERFTFQVHVTTELTAAEANDYLAKVLDQHNKQRELLGLRPDMSTSMVGWRKDSDNGQ